MKKRTLTKALLIVAVIFLVTTLFYSEAFAWGGNSHNRSRGHRGDRGNMGWGRSYRHDYDRYYESDFIGFRIGDIVVRLPIGDNGSYYKKCQRGYIVIPEPCR